MPIAFSDSLESWFPAIVAFNPSIDTKVVQIAMLQNMPDCLLVSNVGVVLEKIEHGMFKTVFTQMELCLNIHIGFGALCLLNITTKN